jgi:hypothetical protein
MPYGRPLPAFSAQNAVSTIVSRDEHEGGFFARGATGGDIPPMKIPRELTIKASTEKGPPARKSQGPHTVKLPNKPPDFRSRQAGHAARAGRAIRTFSVRAIAIAYSLAGSSVTRNFFTLRSAAFIAAARGIREG